MTAQCPDEYFRCDPSGKCIPKGWICDGQGDCPNATDELNCMYIMCMYNIDYAVQCLGAVL